MTAQRRRVSGIESTFCGSINVDEVKVFGSDFEVVREAIMRSPDGQPNYSAAEAAFLADCNEGLDEPSFCIEAIVEQVA
jgi:hypothetical protein